MKKEQEYAVLKQELDGIMEELQSAEVDIDQAVSKYERGMEILKQLEKQLKTAENTVKKIKTAFDKPAS